MDKLKMESKDLVNDNIDRIQELFPGVVTESTNKKGRLIRAIDFDLLKQELSDKVVEGEKERYQLTWPGKKKAMLMANLPTTKTLRPAQEDSVDWDNTENLFIEGDNLEALKILQESYLNQVKCIYIDPPYNTGKDFVYKDDFKQSRHEYLDQSGQMDEEGNRLFQNNESNGRFHSDWLSMMYPRLKLARNLLREDGVIFISIDDGELANLRRICDEIFGEDNFLAELVWHLSSGTQAGHFTRAHESILSFAKRKANLPYFKDISGGTIRHGALKKISSVNPASKVRFKAGSIEFEGLAADFPNELGGSEKQYVVDGKLRFRNSVLAEDVTIKAGWGMKDQLLSWLKGEETFDSKGQKVNKFYFNSKGILFYEKERGTIHPKTVFPSSVGNTKTGGDELIKLFGQKIMDFPKPSSLIHYIAKIILNSNEIFVDFFAGSCTAAHAVMQLNAEDHGNRKYIMVQLPEQCPPDSEAHKAGYKNIAEIGKERIRRAARKIQEETGADIDYGFRVFKVDSSNMKDVYHHPHRITQRTLLDQISNIKEDRTAEDLLIQVMLDSGLQPSLPMEKKTIQGKEVFFVAGNSLVACFDKEIPEQLIHEIAENKPLRVVFQDKSFKDDAARINVDELFKTLSPGTEVKVI